MKRFLHYLVAAAFVLAAIPAPVQAQVPWPQAWLSAETSNLSTGDDTDPILLIKYVGTSASGKIAVETDGNLTFTSGAEGAEAADTTLECPVSGALGGIIDVSDAACDTFGEVLNIINDPDSDWRAVLVGALASDSSNDALLAASAAQANAVDGMTLYADTSTALEMGHLITNRHQLSDYMSDPANTVLMTDWGPGPMNRAVLLSAYTLSTYGSGDSNFKCYSIKRVFNPVDGSMTETATGIFTAANGATTVATSFDASKLGPYGIQARKGESILCQIDNSAELGTATLTTYGLVPRWAN